MSEQELKPIPHRSAPISMQGWPRWVVYFLSLIGVVYLLNPTVGLLEFIPDFAPIIGNLDEGVALWLLFSGMIELFGGKKSGKPIEILTNEDDVPIRLLPEGDTGDLDKSEANFNK